MTDAELGQSMKLPPGKTCADCAHVRRCVLFGFSKPGSVTCDFAPSRFRANVCGHVLDPENDPADQVRCDRPPHADNHHENDPSGFGWSDP